MLYAAYSNYFVISRFHVSNSSDRLRFVRGMSISAILAVLLAAGANTLVLNFWQIAIIFPFALLPVLAFMSVRPHGLKLYVWVAAIFFVFANALGATYSEKFNYQQNFSANFYRTCLVGFSPQQCSPYGTGLTAEQREVIAAQTPQDIEVIKRVIGGIIPHYDYEEILQQQQEAKAQEQAQAQEAQTQTESADQSGEVTVREAITEPAEAPVVEAVAAPAAEPAASAPAASAPDASADEQAAPAADTAASASIEESSPASVVQVAPASEPIVIAVPTASGSQNSGSNANSSGSSNSEPLIIDQGQGASGELVIH